MSEVRSLEMRVSELRGSGIQGQDGQEKQTTGNLYIYPEPMYYKNTDYLTQMRDGNNAWLLISCAVIFTKPTRGLATFTLHCHVEFFSSFWKDTITAISWQGQLSVETVAYCVSDMAFGSPSEPRLWELGFTSLKDSSCFAIPLQSESETGRYERCW
jgi:hypothetical protein